jgi:hypothetical protein
VRLNAHVGCEFALALGGAVVSDWTIEILVPVIARTLCGGVSCFGDSAAVELPGTMGRSDIGADDALKVDLHCPFAKPIGKGGGGLNDQALVQVANAVTIENGCPKAFSDLQRLGFVGGM